MRTNLPSTSDLAICMNQDLAVLDCNLLEYTPSGRSREGEGQVQVFLNGGCRYSVLSACTGSTDAARRAGITPATNAAANSMHTAIDSALLLTVVSP